MKDIVESELSYQIMGLCFKVHKELSRFCRERQYCDKFEQLASGAGIEYLREYELKNLNLGSIGGNRVDFLIGGRVLVDFKAKNYITKEHYYRMQRYLRAAKLHLGLIINFRDSHLKAKRVLNSDFNSHHSFNNSNNSHRI